MGLDRVSLFVCYLCLLQCDLHQARAIEKETTVLRFSMPLWPLSQYTGNDNGDTANEKPSDVVLQIPASGSLSKKTNIIIDMTGKSKQCQYLSEGKLPKTKNKTINVDVYVVDKKNSTKDTEDSGYLVTSSDSEIEDGKKGIQVIGSSKSSTPNSNLTVFVKVYIMDSDKKNESGEPTITTNSTVSNDKGNVADAFTDVEGFEDGNSGGSSSGPSGDGSSDSGSSDGGSSGPSSSDGGSSDSGPKDCGSSDDGSSSGGPSNNSSGSGLSGGGSTSDGSSGSGSSDGGSSGKGSTSGKGSSDSGSKEGGSSDDSSGGGSSGNKSSGSGSSDGDSSGGNSSNGGSSEKPTKPNPPKDGGSSDSGSSGDKAGDGAAAAKDKEDKGTDGE